MKKGSIIYDIAKETAFYRSYGESVGYTLHSDKKTKWITDLQAYSFGYNEIIESFGSIDEIKNLYGIKNILCMELCKCLDSKNAGILNAIEAYKEQISRFVERESIDKFLYKALVSSPVFDDVSYENDGVKVWRENKKYKISGIEEK